MEGWTPAAERRQPSPCCWDLEAACLWGLVSTYRSAVLHCCVLAGELSRNWTYSPVTRVSLGIWVPRGGSFSNLHKDPPWASSCLLWGEARSFFSPLNIQNREKKERVRVMGESANESFMVLAKCYLHGFRRSSLTPYPSSSSKPTSALPLLLF